MNLWEKLFPDLMYRCAVCGLQRDKEQLQNVRNQYYICIFCLELERDKRLEKQEEKIRQEPMQDDGGLFI